MADHSVPYRTRKAPTMTTKTAQVVRLLAPSGNPDNDYFRPQCDACNWHGPMYSNRTIEGRQLAERDARQHTCRLYSHNPTKSSYE